MERDGEITAVLVDVGGFLGVAERDAVLDLDALGFDGEQLTVNMRREEIEALPQLYDE